jgi:NAD(P)-dependent dehydrogenase (short-subunit alcohol dehydrogenase family)
MQGKTVLITGANSGIGKATAAALASKGAQVIITSRDLARGEQAASDIQQATGNSVELLQLDLASFDSIRQCAQQVLDNYPRLDVLINNAGLNLSKRQQTEQGFEYVLGVNHIGPFLLTDLLLNRLKSSAPARIINLASAAHIGARQGIHWDDLQRSKKYGGMAYCEAKLGTIYFTKELAHRYAEDGISAYAVNPGFVSTGFAMDGDTSGFQKFFFTLGKWWMRSPDKGAETSVWAASAEGVEQYNGCYLQDCAVKAPLPVAEDTDAAKRFWDLCEQWIEA